MLYQCIQCHRWFKESSLSYKYGMLVCPYCGSEDYDVIWDEDNPATSVEDFGIEKELADLKGMREASRIRG